MKLHLPKAPSSQQELNDVFDVLYEAVERAFPDRTLDVRAVAFAHVASAIGVFKKFGASDPKALVRALIEAVDVDQLHT